MFEISKVAPQVDVLPFRIRTYRARAPKSEAAPHKITETVNAFWIEHVLLTLVQQLLEANGQVDCFVSRSFIDRAVDVVARIDAGHETAGREIDLPLRDGIQNGYPGVIQRRILRIEPRSLRTHVGDGQAVACVKDGDAIAHLLGVRYEETHNRLGISAIAILVTVSRTGRRHNRN